MIEIVLTVLAFSFLFNREKKSMHGSPALMAVVIIPIWLGIYYLVALKLVERVDNFQLVLLLSYGAGLAAGYGVYRLIVHFRKRSFQRNLDL